MNLKNRTLLFCFSILILSSGAQAADSVCAGLGKIQDSNSQLRMRNCQAIANSGLVANRAALNYSLKFLGDNYGSLADPSCAMQSSSVRKGVLSRAKVRNGIANGCQFVINDLNSRYGGAVNRSNAYYVDLCSKDPRKVVTHFYMNKGTGTSRNGYSDREGAHSSVAGAFLTDSHTFAFHPFKMSTGYRQISRQLGHIPAIRLVGLNSSNNGTDYGKPIHVSPYQSSWGCPSVSVNQAWVLQKLAARGPALVMNYGPSSMHQSTRSCENSLSGSHSKASGRKSRGGNR